MRWLEEHGIDFPRAQAEFRVVSSAGNGKIGPDDEALQRAYCRFYASL